MFKLLFFDTISLIDFFNSIATVAIIFSLLKHSDIPEILRKVSLGVFIIGVIACLFLIGSDIKAFLFELKV